MKLEYVEIGRIVNTHGVRGELKLNPFDLEPERLRRCRTAYIDGAPRAITSARAHKGCLLLCLEGVGDMDAALAWKGKTVAVRREELELPADMLLPAELIGMDVVDDADGAPLGRLADVLSDPGHDVYVVRGEKEFMVPAVPAFIAGVDPGTNTMRIHVWEGLI